MPGRTLAIGDIHGCDIALDTLLSRLQPGRDDTIVTLGDIIDRGPGSRRVVERLQELEQSSRLVRVLGNHEEMFRNALRSPAAVRPWLRYGGNLTCSSYGGSLELIPAAHREFIAAGVNCWESETDLFIHANLEPGVPLGEQTGEWLRWRHLTGLEFPHPSGKRVFCGHTGMPTGIPTVRNGWICLDTLAYRGLYLTAVDVGSGEVFQARQNGEFRSGVTLADL